MRLHDQVIKMIHQQGPITFLEFMELCLYDQNLGYYTSNCRGIGQQGDFYTSPTMTTAFGSTLGRQIEEMWEHLDCIDFTIVEYGAGTGHLCRDILAFLCQNKKMYSQLRYCIIEKSPLMRSNASKILPPDVEWYDDISQIGKINGCVLSNELIDNFSVHRVVMQDTLMEIYVGYQDGFTELLKPAPMEISNYFSELGVILPRGYCTEVNLEAISWISKVSTFLNQGYLITIDYGSENTGIYRADRSNGTLLCYSNNKISDCYYEDIGAKDITSHVNFSALRHWGKKNGFIETGFTNQGMFLHSLDFRNYLLNSLENESDVIFAARKATWLNHKLLIEMGTKFKVLIQQKGAKIKSLMGFDHETGDYKKGADNSSFL